MLIKAYLIIDDLKLVIKDYSMELYKYVDRNTGFAPKNAKHRGFHIVVEAPKNNYLWEQAVKNYSMTPLMQIRFEPAILGSQKTRVISMYDCHIVFHQTSFHHQNNESLIEQVHITCGGMEDSWSPNTVYEEHWRVTYPTDKENLVSHEDEPNLIGMYFEDLEGNKISKDVIDIDEEFFLILKTENAEGESMNVDLKDSSKDYEYNGVHMKNDIIRNIPITGDLIKVKLKAVEQEN